MEIKGGFFLRMFRWTLISNMIRYAFFYSEKCGYLLIKLTFELFAIGMGAGGIAYTLLKL